MSSPLIYLHNDARVLKLMRDGDDEALVILYRQNRTMVASYVTRNNGTPDDAEDMLQEVLIVLWEKVRAGKFEYSAKLSTFIYATMKNMWSRRLARRRREIPQTDNDIDPPDESASILEEIVDEERTKLVQLAMGKLGEQCRKILVLFYWDELSMDQIAAEMSLANADTAKAKKYQCKKELESFLKKLRLGEA